MAVSHWFEHYNFCHLYIFYWIIFITYSLPPYSLVVFKLCCISLKTMRVTLDKMYFNSAHLALLNQEIVHKILKGRYCEYCENSYTSYHENEKILTWLIKQWFMYNRITSRIMGRNFNAHGNALSKLKCRAAFS